MWDPAQRALEDTSILSPQLVALCTEEVKEELIFILAHSGNEVATGTHLDTRKKQCQSVVDPCPYYI